MQPAPQSLRAFLDLVDPAAYEMEELSLCADDDLDDETADLVPTFEGLAEGLRQLHEAARTGHHRFADGHDLPLMRLARTYRHVIPFSSLLESMNQAHRQGVSAD